MESLVYRNNNSGKDVTTSLKVAEAFGKRHDNVLRDIESLECSKEFYLLNFELMLKVKDLPNGAKREDKFYEITKDGFSFLVMGYTGSKAAKFKENFINEFNKRESLLKSDEYILSRAFGILNEKAKMLEQEIDHKNKIIEIQAPKVQYYDKVISASGLFPITLIAQQANMTARKLNDTLKEKKIQRKVNGTWVLSSKYLNHGYASLKTHTFTDSQGKERTSQQLYWTEKGKEFILSLLGLTGRSAAA